MSDKAIWKVIPSSTWTDEVLNWFTKTDTERKRNFKQNTWYYWLQKWEVTWKIIGWCITSILHLRWTKYWPSFKDKILFWESPESSHDITKWEPLSRIDAHLQDLKLSWIFNQIKWMIIGIPKWYTDKEKEDLNNLVKKYITGYNYPVLTNINIWHTDPIITLPIWVNVKLDSYNNLFEIIENWTK
jgi:muramoyltetrapeptide carboxypeptidase LdcA involved in peptidoglycan recycling